MTAAADRRARLDDARTWAGFRQAAFTRQTGTMVVVLDAWKQGADDDPENRWMTLCDDHGSLVVHSTLKLAVSHAPDPLGWCEDCRTIHDTEESTS